jgi:hypothetical protein
MILSSYKGKANTQLKKEFLDMVEQTFLQVMLAGVRGKSQEIKVVGVV